MGRRPSRESNGLRELLIADRQAGVDSWNRRDAPGWPADRPPMRDRLLEELKAGGPVEVGAADLMCALHRAGLDYRRFAFGGADWARVFVLTERNELVELSD
jgi:hypothetical protein